MKEGYWINARTGKYWQVDEHCMFAKRPEGADAMGLPQSVRDKIAPLTCDFNGPTREQIVLLIMQAGYIRFRGHGSQYTCEFYGDTKRNLWACFDFLREMAGPFTYILLHNLKTKEQWSGTFQDLNATLKEDEDKVLRMAKALIWNPQGPMPEDS